MSRHSELALIYRRRYRATLRGALEGGSSWDAALSALPNTSRSSIVDVLQHGSLKEKKRLYELLPEDQKAVFGYRLGIDPRKIPRMEALEDYARKNAIPDERFAGWRADISLDLIKAKDVVERKLDPIDFGYYPGTVDEATQGSPEAFIPSPRPVRRRSLLEIEKLLKTLLTGRGLTHVQVSLEEQSPDSGQDSHQASVQLNVRHDRTRSFFHHYKRLQSRGG